MIAVSESTPGPIMVNLATYVGSSQGGLTGAITATLAVVLPSFLIIVLVMKIWKYLLKNQYAQAVLRGLKPCIIGIILATGIYMVISHIFPAERENGIDMATVVITAVLAVVIFGTKKIIGKSFSPILLIAISAFLGVTVYGI